MNWWCYICDHNKSTNMMSLGERRGLVPLNHTDSSSGRTRSKPSRLQALQADIQVYYLFYKLLWKVQYIYVYYGERIMFCVVVMLCSCWCHVILLRLYGLKLFLFFLLLVVSSSFSFNYPYVVFIFYKNILLTMAHFYLVSTIQQ